MVGRTQYERLESRLVCVRLLRVLKKHMKYRELMRLTDLSPAIMSRYVVGKIIPHQKRADELLEMVSRKIRNYIDFEPETNDIDLLSIYADLAFKELMGLRVTKVLTSEFDNIPFATLVAERIARPIVIASTRMRDMKNICVVVHHFEPLFVARSMIKRRDSILIVSNLAHVRDALRRICEKARADITGMLWIDKNGIVFKGEE